MIWIKSSEHVPNDCIRLNIYLVLMISTGEKIILGEVSPRSAVRMYNDASYATAKAMHWRLFNGMD